MPRCDQWGDKAQGGEGTSPRSAAHSAVTATGWMALGPGLSASDSFLPQDRRATALSGLAF